MAAINPITPGTRFVRLSVIRYLPEKKSYECKCTCGKIVYARSYTLRNGRSKSCGCYHRDEMLSRIIKPNYQALKNEVFKNYKQAANRRKHEFSLSFERFCELIISNCYYCNTPPNTAFSGAQRKYITKQVYFNGVDRLNNNIGYTVENSVSCCKICNNSKASLTTKEWFEWIKVIYKNLESNEF